MSKTTNAPQKVFVVGAQKTGTSSATRALRALGFNIGTAMRTIGDTVDYDGDDVRAQMARAVLLAAVKADGLQDSPGAFFAKDLDEAYPDAKFILTVRSTQSWLDSMLGYFPNTT